MPNYQDGKIYKIVCNITDECYIGSTCEPTLARRLAGHVGNHKHWIKSGNNGKCQCFDIIGRENYQILLIEYFPCNSKDELTAREGEIIRQHKKSSNCTNRCIPGRTVAEYERDNKDKRKEYRELPINQERKRNYDNEYRENNHDKVKEIKKKYEENNKEQIKERKKIYREINKDKIKKNASKKITCDCGACIRHDSIHKHNHSIKHKKYLESHV
jgi:hypothetical protein